MSDLLEKARESYERRSWSDAYHALLRADQASPLEIDDLERSIAGVHESREHRPDPGECRKPRVTGRNYFTSTMSFGFHVLSKKGSRGPLKRKIVNQPLPGVVWIQFLELFPEPVGASGPKPMSDDGRLANASLGVAAIILVRACFLAPITEELLFRGVLFAWLRQRLSASRVLELHGRRQL
jgi:Type II CAAX prenyl endopeptidase Rce1-like